MSVSELTALEDDQTPLFHPIRSLPSDRPTASSLPEDLLPSPLREWCTDISERLQVPLEMAAIPAIVCLSALIGRRRTIHPKVKDDWRVVPNLWGGLIARPGKLKSPTLGQVMRPLRLLSSQARELHEKEEDERDAEIEELKARASGIKDAMRAKSKKTDKTDSKDRDTGPLKNELAGVLESIRQLEESSGERRYIVNDTTVEKLGELFQHNPQGLLLERDELSGWLRSLDREDRKGDREFFLEAWNGDESYTYDRIGRGTIHIPALCLSVIGGIQPAKFSKAISDAIDGGYAADGLIQRFQLLVWPEDDSRWSLIDRHPNSLARQKVEALFGRLDKMEIPSNSEPGPALRFAPEAQELFFDWLTKLETQVRADEIKSTPAFESHLAKYRSLMPSLALIFHLVESRDEDSPVSLSAARTAADWCGFLEEHARKIYAAELTPGNSKAQALAAKIRSGAIVSGMTLRDIYNNKWSHLRTSDCVMKGLQVLEEHGWAQLRIQRTGGRPKSCIVINPALNKKRI